MESVCGTKKIEALGALKLLSGGFASLASVDDLNLVVGQRHNAVIGGDMQELIRGLRKSVAAVGQQLQAPKTWQGSKSVNVLQVLCDVIDLLEQMNMQLAGHKHGPTPDNAADFAANATTALIQAGKLKPIVL